jgi:hypothetical protein
VGQEVVRKGRWDTEDDAEDLWTDIKEVNDLFVKKLADEVKRIESERAEKEKAEKTKTEKVKPAEKPEKSHPAKPHKLKTPLEEVLGKHYKSLAPWAKTGFFHLPLDLVLELHAHGFTWGATFSTNVDLHHFELHE